MSACNGRQNLSDWPQRNFSPEEWSSTPENARYVFVKNLLKRNLLAGKTAPQVEKVLGHPSFDANTEASPYMTYVVKVGGEGFEQVFLLDIRFDPVSHRVIRSFVRAD
jgi:hypothetical protein